MSRARDFGAVGDGQTDDTAALQHAIDDGDGVLELSKGSYRITRTLEFDLTQHGYLGIRGDQGTARIVMTGPGPACRFVGGHQGTADPGRVEPHTWDGERFPVIAGIEILGEHPEADGIQLVRTMQATIQNMLVRRCRYGLHLVERNRNLVVSASHIYDCHDSGVFFDQCNLHQVIISGNQISYCKRAGIRQLNGDVHNIQITGNDIEYNSGFPGSDDEVSSGEIVLEAPEGIISEYTIASNTLQATLDAPGANVLIDGMPTDPPTGVRLVTISGNVLGSRRRNLVVRRSSRISLTGNTIYGGTELNIAFADCQYATIGSNTLVSRPANYSSDTRDGVLLENCRGCALMGNVLNECGYGDDGSGGCITLRRCEDIAVTASQILNPGVRGIDLIDSSHCRISDNAIHQEEGRAMLTAIRVAGQGRHNLVQNNSLHRGSRGTIDMEPSCGKDSNNTVW